MSNFSSRDHEDANDVPLNERSSAFIDGAAFLNFVRLKSLVSPDLASTEETSASPLSACQARCTSLEKATSLQTTEIAIKDWDLLFSAVENRLRNTVAQLDSAPAPASVNNAGLSIKAVVLDCVNALDQLHVALRQERRLHASGHL